MGLFLTNNTAKIQEIITSATVGESLENATSKNTKKIIIAILEKPKLRSLRMILINLVACKSTTPLIIIILFKLRNSHNEVLNPKGIKSCIPIS